MQKLESFPRLFPASLPRPTPVGQPEVASAAQLAEKSNSGCRRPRHTWYLSPRVVGWILGSIAGALVLSLPAPAALDHPGFSTLAATVAAMIWWAVDVGAGAAAIVYTLVLLALGEPATAALAGWAEPGFWFFAAMLFYGIAMTSTGLDRRIAHAILSNVRPSYTGLLTALAIIGFVLALLIPTLRVRMAILVSISWSVSQAIGRPRHSRESFLLALATWVAAIIPGLAVPAVGLGAGRVRELLAPEPLGGLTWLGWATFFIGPAIILTGVALVLVYWALRPVRPLHVARTYFRHRQLRLGKPDRRERLALLIFLASLAAWITKEWHGIPESYVAVAGTIALIATSAVRPRDLAQWPLWSTILFFATLFALPHTLAQHGITAWLGGYLEPFLHVGTDSLVIALVFLMSARSSSSWAAVGPAAPMPSGPAERKQRYRGRVALDIRSPRPTFVYVHEVPSATVRVRGRRIWAARVQRTPSASGESVRRWGSPTRGIGAVAAGRSGPESRGGPWRRL